MPVAPFRWAKSNVDVEFCEVALTATGLEVMSHRIKAMKDVVLPAFIVPFEAVLLLLTIESSK